MSGGLAVALGSTALSGVLDGYRWLWYVLLVVGVVVGLGLLTRRAHCPLPVILGLQLVGLLVVLVEAFGKHLSFGVLPTADTMSGLFSQLGDSIDQIENGIPPVTTTPALSVLVTLGFGLVMLAVDALVIAGHGPSATGLVLLGGYTVPAALDPDALPAWTFVVGAGGYALHLMLAHRERLARRGILAEPPRPPTAPGVLRRPWQRLRAASRASTGIPVTVALTAVALAFTLGLSSLATVIGTDGRFAGHGRGHSKSSDTEFGLNPFTTLRGELAKTKDKELFRVRGLPGPQYLRALTLTQYVANQGWRLPDQHNGVTMNGSLPSGIATPVNNPTATIQVENVGFKDRWLPLYGLPMSVGGLVPGRWQYDVITNTAFAANAVTEPAWTERAGLPNPALATLEASQPVQDVAPTYLDTSGVSPQIAALAHAVTKSAASPFTKAIALTRYFLDPANGFRYNVKTAPGSNTDALTDFLFSGKTGYCEQFASAMAVMLREVGVPSRVAIGFTSGQPKGDYQSITSADAHAWVEAYLAGVGWLTFDPTPLDDGRTITPSYVGQAPVVPVNVPPSVLAAGQQAAAAKQGPQAAQPQPGQQGQTPGQSQAQAQQPKPGQQPGQGPRPGPPQPGPGQTPSSQGDSAGTSGPTPSAPNGQSGSSSSDNNDDKGSDKGNGADNGGSDGDNGGSDKDKPDHGINGHGLDELLSGIGLVVLLMLLGVVVVAALVASPAAVRSVIRRTRLAVAARGGTEGAEAAWREVLAEFADRGAAAEANSTVRGSARTLAKTHQLNGPAVSGIRTVVGAVERGWYAPPAEQQQLPDADLVTAVSQVRGGLDTSAPLSVGARLWPRSVMPYPRRGGHQTHSKSGRRP